MITVNALSKHSGVSAHTVRYYSRIGLLNPRRDPRNGYRVFDSTDLNRLRFIRSAQHLGFTLSEIYEILGIAEQGHSPCKRVRDILSRRIRENKRKIDELLCLQTRMEKAMELWRKLPDDIPGKNSVCRLIDCASEALSTESDDVIEELHYA